MEKHIFLLGFMGSGKTYWGKRLAEKLGRPFFDLDALIVEQEGKTIAAIFEESGEQGFRQLEQQRLHELAALPPAVVAAGGGTPCFFDNMAWMKGHGRTVYLHTPPEVLFERLKDERHHRPLLNNLDDEGLRAFIRERLALREPFYCQADIVLEQAGEDAAFWKALSSDAIIR